MLVVGTLKDEVASKLEPENVTIKNLKYVTNILGEVELEVEVSGKYDFTVTRDTDVYMSEKDISVGDGFDIRRDNEGKEYWEKVTNSSEKLVTIDILHKVETCPVCNSKTISKNNVNVCSNKHCISRRVIY